MYKYINTERKEKINCYDSYLEGEREGNKQVFYYLKDVLAEEDFDDLYCEYFGLESPKEGEG